MWTKSTEIGDTSVIPANDSPKKNVKEYLSNSTITNKERRKKMIRVFDSLAAYLVMIE